MSRRRRPSTSPYEKLEAAMKTLEKECRFFEALIAADPVATVVNRVVHLVTFFQQAQKFIPPYLVKNAAMLFPNESFQVAAILYSLLTDITRSARLAGYMCVKGIPEQALSVLRGAIEQTGVYAHVWHEPQKYCFVPASDSKEYARAFRFTDDETLKADLKTKRVKFRFMYCTGASAISTAYDLLSTYFVHGSRAAIGNERQESLSCEFVDRDSPGNLARQFEQVQSIMAMVYMEILACLPKDDMVADDGLVALSVISGLLLPLVAFAPESEQAALSEKLLEALGKVEFERPTK
jgi:hypothetical protein